MTVQELIEKLQKFNPNLEVVVDNIAAGTYEITDIDSTATVVRLNFNSNDEE